MSALGLTTIDPQTGCTYIIQVYTTSIQKSCCCILSVVVITRSSIFIITQSQSTSKPQASSASRWPPTEHFEMLEPKRVRMRLHTILQRKYPIDVFTYRYEMFGRANQPASQLFYIFRPGLLIQLRQLRLSSFP